MSINELSGPATLRWTGKTGAHERHLPSIKAAVHAAMKELTRAEFFSAHIATADGTYAGDQIAEIYLTGKAPVSRYARF